MSYFDSLRRAVERYVPFLLPKITRLRQHSPRPMRIPEGRKLDNGAWPQITLVTPSLNQGCFIERTLRSVLDQQYPALEYVVVDGGSRDGTVEVLRRYEDRLARSTSAPDNGQSDAVNRGFDETTGEIMGWLNSDDLLLPGALATLATYFREHPEVDVVYGHRLIIDEQDREIGRWILPAHDGEVLKWIDWVPQETLFWRRRAWHRIGAHLDATLQFAMDWDLLLRFHAAGLNISRVDAFIGAFRIHDQQKTRVHMAGVGQEEIRCLRLSTFGREVGRHEIFMAVAPYLVRQIFVDLKWRAGLSHF